MATTYGQTAAASVVSDVTLMTILLSWRQATENAPAESLRD